MLNRLTEWETVSSLNIDCFALFFIVVQPGHIISEVPEGSRCVSFYIRHPHPGDPAWWSVAKFVPGRTLWPSLITFQPQQSGRLCCFQDVIDVSPPLQPVYLHSDWPVKLLYPTSIGLQHSFHSSFKLSAVGSSCFPPFPLLGLLHTKLYGLDLQIIAWGNNLKAIVVLCWGNILRFKLYLVKVSYV